MVENYFVSMENTIGQVTWTRFDSKEDFEKFYSKKMQDGSGMSVKEAYPKIHYQGTDQSECQRINTLLARRRMENPLAPTIYALAETRGGKGLAKALYDISGPNFE